jgi:hypothetical protein
MTDDRGTKALFDGIARGMDEKRYEIYPETGSDTLLEPEGTLSPETLTPYDEPKCGVDKDDRLTLKPFGVRKSRIATDHRS